MGRIQAMTTLVLEGDPVVRVHLRRSARARRLSLRVSRLDGKVSLTVPTRAPEREALAFLREKENWLRHQLAGQPVEQIVGMGAQVPLGGQLFEIVQGQGRRISIQGTQLQVPGRAETAGARVQGYFKAQARLVLHREVEQFATALGKPFGRITLRDTRSRWGSCSSTGDLNFSWRLVMAPPNVLSYVAAHEVAHLAQMNHSERFWRVCEELFGPYKAERAWLRTEGTALHRYRFG
jgi:predicted metal-dependent hydrolase